MTASISSLSALPLTSYPPQQKESTMSDINSYTGEGRLTRDPQVINTENGKIVRFTIAQAEHYKSGDEIKENVTFNPVAIYDKFKAEYAEKNLHKGSHVIVQGAVETHSYDSEGSTRYATEIALRPGKAFLKLLDVKPKQAEAVTSVADSIGPREKQQINRQHTQ